MSDRWFFALWPDAPAQAALAAGAAESIPPGAHAADPRDLHLTLAFLGQLSPAALDAAVQAAGSVRAGPLALRIDHVGYFPRARVLWCASADPSSGLLKLYGQLSRALADRGIAIESRPYRPHITLARKVGRAPRQDWYPPVEWISGELVLARGLEGRVPRYEHWRRWPLVADATGGAVPAPDL